MTTTPTPRTDSWCDLAVSASISDVLELAKSYERELAASRERIAFLESNSKNMSDTIISAVAHGDEMMRQRDASRELCRQYKEVAEEIISNGHEDKCDWINYADRKCNCVIAKLEALNQSVKDAKCQQCGDTLRGHEDESGTCCRWCVTGWTRCGETNSAIPSPSQDVYDGEEIRCPDCKATGGTSAEEGEAWLCWNEDGEEQK